MRKAVNILEGDLLFSHLVDDFWLVDKVEKGIVTFKNGFEVTEKTAEKFFKIYQRSWEVTRANCG